MDQFIPTATSLGQFGQPQQRIVAWDLLERNIAVPPALCTLLAVCKVQQFVLVDLLCLFRADDADLIVTSAETAASVNHRVDVQLRSLWLARELTQTLYELLLEIVGDVILLAEEDNTALRDWISCQGRALVLKHNLTYW